MRAAEYLDYAVVPEVACRPEDTGIPAQKKYHSVAQMPSAGIRTHSEARCGTGRSHFGEVVYGGSALCYPSSQYIFDLYRYPAKLYRRRELIFLSSGADVLVGKNSPDGNDRNRGKMHGRRCWILPITGTELPSAIASEQYQRQRNESDQASSSHCDNSLLRNVREGRQLQRSADKFLQIHVAFVVHLFVDTNRRTVIGKCGSALQGIEEFLVGRFGVPLMF